MNAYAVIVGNLGTVFDGANQRKAIRAFREYVSQSKAGYGRASGENVTLTRDGEPMREFFHPAAEMRADLENGECAVIHASGEVTLNGKHVARIGAQSYTYGKPVFVTEKDALRALRNAMESAQFWPNCYRINDHGNVSCISVKTGKAFKGMEWV